MKHKRIFCCALACFVALAMLAPISFAPVHVYAESFSDTSGHWAEPYINTAVNKGIATGYSDGTFKPDKPVTRAEFASMVNKALGNKGTASIAFADVPSSEWYYSDVSKAVAAAYVSGYDNNSFKPNNPITREEAAVMISRIVPGHDTAGNLRTFGDYGSISNWALTGMQKSNGKGYVGAYNDGSLHPKDKLTRAQTVKIICDIIDKETIVTDAPSVKADRTTLSGKIYSNGVIIHKDLGENSAMIDNCVVMGDLTIQGGGSNSIEINNSRIADCSVAKNGSSVRVVAKGDTCILNTDVSYTARLETSNLAGGDSGAGFSGVNANRSSTLTLRGSFPKINLAGAGAEVKLEAGTIDTLEVSSSATDSDITADSDSTIEKANVNSAADFHGTGTIRTMNANANNITYEKEPSTINIGYGVITKPQGVGASLRISFDPVDGATDVAANKAITITFSQAITKYDGKAVTGPDLKDLIVFTKESTTGTDIAFSASISSSNKVITITPDSSLAKDTKYCISFDKNIFKDSLENGNAAQSTSFKVGSGVANSVAFDPAQDATGVSKAVKPIITFSSAIEKYAGGNITASYLASNIHFRKDSSSGSVVGFSAAINSSGNVITITPDSELTAGQKYYLSFDNEVFRTNSDDKAVAGQGVAWTVASSAMHTVSFDPVQDATGVSKAVKPIITFSSAIEKYAGGNITASYLVNNIHFRKDSSSGSVVGFSAAINSSGNVITITPDSELTAGQKYYLNFDNEVFRTNSDDKAVAGQYVTWTVASSAMPTISFKPENGATGISVTSNVTITFSEKIFNSSGSVPSNLNVSSSVTLRDNTAGSNVTYTPYVYDSGSGTSFAINPLYYGMVAGHNYTVTVKGNSFKNSEGNYAPSASASFTLVTNVDVTALTTAITRANNVKTGVVTSVDGSDVHTSVYWVTAAQMETLNNAISTATGSMSTLQTTAAAEAAAAALDRAVTAFEQAKKTGVKASVDTSEIDHAIKNVEILRKGTVISLDGTDVDPTVQWVTQEVMDALDDAIDKAEGKKATVQTNDEVTEVVLELNWAAVKHFYAKKSYGTKGGDADRAGLAAAINKANNLIEATEASDDGTDIPIGQYWTTRTELSAFASDMGAAMKVLNNASATEAEVDAATSQMLASIDEFNNTVRKAGLKEIQ